VIKEQKLVVSIAVVLAALGAFCLAMRARSLEGPALPGGQSIWRLTYEVEMPSTKGARVYVAIPQSTAHCRVFKESFSYHGLWMDTVRGGKTHTREIVIVPLLGSKQGRFTADFDIHLSKNDIWKTTGAKAGLSAQEVSYYLREEPAVQVSTPVVSVIVAGLRSNAGSKTELLENIFDYCSENMVPSGVRGPTDAARSLEYRRGTCVGRARAMVALCRAVKIPARLVSGFELTTPSEPQMHCWVEAFTKKGWRSYDPVNGYRGEMPSTFVPIRVDGSQIVRASAADADLRTRWSIRRIFPSPVPKTRAAHGWLSVLDLTRLSPGMQAVIALILLLPFGALMTALLRNIVGIRTFGTFTPALIALSFVQADWRTGTLALVVILGVGVLAQLGFNKLKILMVPRLGIILTLVILLMVLGVSILDYLGLTPTASATLLPMVILTMMVERFNVMAEEDGYAEAFKVLGGTLVAAICCLLLLRVDFLSRLVLVFPEVPLIVAAALLLIGRYAGYRLTELWRFRDFASSAMKGRH
jgi:transglutaminase-like putative cysteine protease